MLTMTINTNEKSFLKNLFSSVEKRQTTGCVRKKNYVSKFYTNCGSRLYEIFYSNLVRIHGRVIRRKKILRKINCYEFVKPACL